MDSVRSNYWSPARCPGPVPRLRNVVVAFPFSGSASIKSEHVPQSHTQTHREWAVTHTDTDKLPSQHLCTQDAHRQRHRQRSPLLLLVGFSHRHPKITGTPRWQPRLEALLLSSWLRDWRLPINHATQTPPQHVHTHSQSWGLYKHRLPGSHMCYDLWSHSSHQNSALNHSGLSEADFQDKWVSPDLVEANGGPWHEIFLVFLWLFLPTDWIGCGE